MGTPPQDVEIDLNMLISDFYVLITTSRKGSRYDDLFSQTIGMGPCVRLSRLTHRLQKSLWTILTHHARNLVTSFIFLKAMHRYLFPSPTADLPNFPSVPLKPLVLHSDSLLQTISARHTQSPYSSS